MKNPSTIILYNFCYGDFSAFFGPFADFDIWVDVQVDER